MTYVRTFAIGFIICAALAAWPGRTGAQSGQLTLSGRVSLQTKGALPRFTVRLYPPRETKQPILATYTDAAGNFKFSALQEGRYLLELYQDQKTLVYQKVLTLDRNLTAQPLNITLNVRR